jgi:serine/threonine-protein kinase
VKLPDNSPTLTTGVPHPQQVQKGSSRRVLSKVKLCAGLVASVAWLEAGCTGVQTRPDPEPCPEEALKAMKQELDWGLNSYGPAIVMDVTKGWTDDPLEEPTATYKDGPVTGAVIPPPEGKEPVGTRVDGHLWTTGDRIYGRYIRAHLPGGRIVPICIELENSDGLGSRKMAGSKPGAAVAPKVSSTRVAKRWR